MKDVAVRTRDRIVAEKAAEQGFTALLVDAPFAGLAGIDQLVVADGTITRDGTPLGDWVVVASKRDELAVAALKGKQDLVVVDAQDWKVIPLENLIAALEGKTRLWAVAADANEARLFLTTLETGVDGVVIEPVDAGDLSQYRTLLDQQRQRHVLLEEAEVTRVEAIGMGERVCIDTCNLLAEGEGMLIGSSSQGFFLVAAETRETEYVRARPFRVNAGAIHSYVLTDTRTNYLSELEAGVALEAVHRDGSARPVVVGRCKIETRPLMLVEAQIDDTPYHVILQNAETIRVAAAEGGSVPVTELKPGQRVLLHRQQGARHFGMKIEERIEEK